MSVKSNKETIIKAMQQAGTYRDEFEKTIETLAKMMDECKKAEKAFKDSGGKFVVEYTNKAGATNQVKNPHFAVVETLRKDMLTYYTALGLTPAGLKKINEKSMTRKKQGKLSGVLKNG